jgi:putative transposase
LAQKNLALSLARGDRVALVERVAGELPLSVQADLLSLSRSGLYYQSGPPSTEEVRLKHRIDEVNPQYPFYGARKIAAQLQLDQMGINRKTVARYMREMGIAAIYPGPNLSRCTQQEQVFPRLLRHVTCNYPNHVWGTDITYIRLHAGWMYLLAILDWYSRYVGSPGVGSDAGTAVCLNCRAASGCRQAVPRSSA